MRGSNRETRGPVLFATSNRGKLEEARFILAPFGIAVRQCDAKGVEIQAETTSEVAATASRAAAREIRKAVLVEDAGLFVESLGGFPGVYSAYAFKTIGTKGILDLLGAKPRAATFVSSAAFCEPSGEPKVFEGSARGTIAKTPRGTRGFGFDPIFFPGGKKLTFAQLTQEEKCLVSHRGESLRRFARWYATRSVR